ncbi:MAG: ATP-binding protein [Bdellovibrionota bacterium]
MLERLEEIRKFLLYHALVIWRTKAFWLRALICWGIGSALLMSDDLGNFDSRLQIRGPRPSTANIVIIDVSEREWNAFIEPESRNVLRPLKEVISLSDTYFWNESVWERVLEAVLSDEPASIGVMFFFGDTIRPRTQTPKSRSIFSDPRIIWGADVDSAGRLLVPAFAETYNSNVGLRGVRSDDDGTVRRFQSSILQIPHIGVRVAEAAALRLKRKLARKDYQSQALINFVGPADVFRVVSFRDLLEGRVDPETFRDKVVLIGNLSSPLEQMQTPLGRMSRTEVMANIVDNVVLEKSVVQLPIPVYVGLLAVLMVAMMWVLVSYPQSVALVFYVMTGVLWTSLSAYAFDVLLVWIPVLAPIVQLALTYIVFLSYRLTLNEQRTWRLEQEQKYLTEIEQLKTNFVSMMSHDLKTPIAKIQAICDRLLSAVPDSEIAPDLKTLRRSSDDLHRYIQSILQVTKVEAKDFKIAKEVTDINENIDKVVGHLKPLADEKGITLATVLEPMFSIEADTTLIQEVILNLVENAIKYTPRNGRVTITSSEKDDNVEVLVEDTGPGIAPEEQKEIWGKFTRGRSQDSLHGPAGTGLGLYLVKYFIELHGGSVFLSSELGRGTRIGFKIPIAPESVSEAV